MLLWTENKYRIRTCFIRIFYNLLLCLFFLFWKKINILKPAKFDTVFTLLFKMLLFYFRGKIWTYCSWKFLIIKSRWDQNTRKIYIFKFFINLITENRSLLQACSLSDLSSGFQFKLTTDHTLDWLTFNNLVMILFQLVDGVSLLELKALTKIWHTVPNFMRIFNVLEQILYIWNGFRLIIRISKELTM